MNPQTLSVLFLVLFAFSTLGELVCCFMEWETPRKAIKPFCVAFLAVSFLLVRPDLYLVGIGLILGAIGDLLLVFKHKVWTFVVGAFSFLLNHVCFILAYIFLLPSRPIGLWISMAVLVVAVFLSGFFALRKVIKTPPLRAGGVLYFAAILCDLLLAIFALGLTQNPAFISSIVGMVFFVGSDVYLTKTLFVRDDRRRDFYIMLTYLLAQGLVALGFFLC